MIDITKTYQTRCGYPVRLYAKDGGGEYPVHGAYFSQGKWIVFCWSIMGEAYIGRTSELDLIEVKPRIQAGRMTIEHLAKRLADVERWIGRWEDY